MQVLDGVSRCQWSRSRITAPGVCSVIDAHAVVVAQQAWYEANVRASVPVQIDDRRRAGAFAVEIQVAATTNVEEAVNRVLCRFSPECFEDLVATRGRTVRVDSLIGGMSV
jgi:hypothetical protein